MFSGQHIAHAARLAKRERFIIQRVVQPLCSNAAGIAGQRQQRNQVSFLAIDRSVTRSPHKPAYRRSIDKRNWYIFNPASSNIFAISWSKRAPPSAPTSVNLVAPSSIAACTANSVSVSSFSTAAWRISQPRFLSSSKSDPSSESKSPITICGEHPYCKAVAAPLSAAIHISALPIASKRAFPGLTVPPAKITTCMFFIFQKLCSFSTFEPIWNRIRQRYE